MAPPVFGIAGWKNAGKTTLTTRLIADFAARGLRVAAVKHSHHAAMADGPGTDSARHRAAGAAASALVWPGGWMLDGMRRDDREPALDEVLAALPACDLVLVEGYKGAPHDKIETRRADQPDPRRLEGTVPGVVAVVADHAVETAVPRFHSDDLAAIAGFILERTGLRLP